MQRKAEEAGHSEGSSLRVRRSSLPSASKATAGLRLGPTSPQPRGGTSVGKAGPFQAAQGSWRASVEVRGTAVWETGREQSGRGREPCLEEHVNVALAEGGMASQPR